MRVLLLNVGMLVVICSVGNLIVVLSRTHFEPALAVHVSICLAIIALAMFTAALAVGASQRDRSKEVGIRPERMSGERTD